MKKTLLSFGILCIVLFSVLISGRLIKWTFVELFYAEPTIMQTYVSPDGKYTAYVYESNGGATTGWIYHISILPTEEKLGKGNGNIYINTSIPPKGIKWISNNELYVDDYKSANTKKQEESIYNIIIHYSSLK